MYNPTVKLPHNTLILSNITISRVQHYDRRRRRLIISNDNETANLFRRTT